MKKYKKKLTLKVKRNKNYKSKNKKLKKKKYTKKNFNIKKKYKINNNQSKKFKQKGGTDLGKGFATVMKYIGPTPNFDENKPINQQGAQYMKSLAAKGAEFASLYGSAVSMGATTAARNAAANGALVPCIDRVPSWRAQGYGIGCSLLESTGLTLAQNSF